MTSLSAADEIDLGTLARRVARARARNVRRGASLLVPALAELTFTVALYADARLKPQTRRAGASAPSNRQVSRSSRQMQVANAGVDSWPSKMPVQRFRVKCELGTRAIH